MNTLYDIIQELNLENGSNYKIAVLKKYADNKSFQLLLKMTYDSVAYNYGIRKIPEHTPSSNSTLSIEDAMGILAMRFAIREVTGNAAIDLLHNLLSSLSEQDGELLQKIIKRDLRINMGRSNINKVYKGLITKPIYMRCGIYSQDKELDELDKKDNPKIKKGTAREINFPSFIQLKADGTYREFIIHGDKVKCHSRSGESYDYPLLYSNMGDYSEGVYHGELTVILDDKLLQEIIPKLEKLDKKNGSELVKEITEAYQEANDYNKEYILPRAIGNGLINSDNPPHENIIVEFWDYITLEEYSQAGLKDRKNPCKTPYELRFQRLQEIISTSQPNIRVIPYYIVDSLEDAVKYTSMWMKAGYEGAIIKDKMGVFKDGTSKHQLKMKVSFDIDVRITGFIEGTPGTKRELTFGSMTYETDDGMIKGSVSGFTDDQLEDFNSRRKEMIDKIMTIEGNDLTMARGNNYYAVSHPRYIEIRTDKDETDSLERAQESLEMAKLFKDR